MTARYLKIIASVPEKPPMPWPVIPDKDLNLFNCRVYFDFDNTITPFDVLDGIIEQFSINRDWEMLEDAWQNGRIGSRECLAGQLSCIRVTKRVLSEYLSTVPLDPCFSRLLDLLRHMGISPTILSDSFSFLIEYILKNNGIQNVAVCSNRLTFDHDRLVPSFPYTNSLCPHCAHCKTSNMVKEAQHDMKTIYIGDGLSDICPAHHADYVFAKATLLEHFKKTERQCMAFRDFEAIYNYLKEYCNESLPERMRAGFAS